MLAAGQEQHRLQLVVLTAEAGLQQVVDHMLRLAWGHSQLGGRSQEGTALETLPVDRSLQNNQSMVWRLAWYTSNSWAVRIQWHSGQQPVASPQAACIHNS